MDFEDGGGMHALILELVEGPTLADKLARGSGLKAREPANRRSARHRAPDLRRARSGPRARDHSPRSQTREHQGARRRHGQGARLRAGKDREVQSPRSAGPGADAVAYHHDASHDGGGNDPRHRGLHVAGAGEGEASRQAQRHLGVWLSCSTRCLPASARSRGRCRRHAGRDSPRRT